MQKHLIIGLGVSGLAASAFLLKKGERVVAVDQKWDSLRSRPDVAALLNEGLELFSDAPDLSLDLVSLVLLSPGISPSHPLVKKAIALGIEVIGEMEFALKSIENRCIGVTGTNGKTTTVLLITHILNQAGIAARALGNVGDPLSSYLLKADRKEVLILELSSFQLETLHTKRLEAALILNITPDHLDRYATLSEYAAAKIRIRDCLFPGGRLWISRQVGEMWNLSAEWFNPSFDFTPWNDETVAAISTLRYIPTIQLGVPERENIQAAYAVCTHLGVTKFDFCRGLETFRKPAHRIEWVGEKEGVAFYNDSKATNIDSVMHALSLFTGPLILLAGGVDKGASYAPWIDSFRKKVKKVIAFGQAASKMESELSAAFSFQQVETMEEALLLAMKEADRGTTVLLSPGCSSYDQFRNYEHRGDEFKRLVRGLL